jgi:hypothetical protein
MDIAGIYKKPGTRIVRLGDMWYKLLRVINESDIKPQQPLHGQHFYPNYLSSTLGALGISKHRKKQGTS